VDSYVTYYKNRVNNDMLTGCKRRYDSYEEGKDLLSSDTSLAWRFGGQNIDWPEANQYGN
jgi:hypothetical protein